MKTNSITSRIKDLKEGWAGLAIAFIIGISAYIINIFSDSGLMDPLLVAMLIGVIVNVIFGKKEKLAKGFAIAPAIFLPIGIVFYGMATLNFVKFSAIDFKVIILLLSVILAYFLSIIISGFILKQKSQITYLTATGSAICGASAIAVTAPAVEAEPDDVSISLLSVAISATFGLFLILPFLAVLLNMDNQSYALFSAAIMQFTGFVKASIGTMPILPETMAADNLLSFALSIKAARYLGLIVAIPLFASMYKKKFTLPWYLWAFLGAGILGSVIYNYNAAFFNDAIKPVISPVYNLLWAVAMAAIGLNTNVKVLLSNQGIKALFMALIGFSCAIIVFIFGMHTILA